MSRPAITHLIKDEFSFDLRNDVSFFLFFFFFFFSARRYKKQRACSKYCQLAWEIATEDKRLKIDLALPWLFILATWQRVTLKGFQRERGAKRVRRRKAKREKRGICKQHITSMSQGLPQLSRETLKLSVFFSSARARGDN